ncbi:MMPL family transporter [Streptomyces fragilis]|uniref:MMPL family transporter n=1 Tax=Streptomyces fragilis TaxID=67301 RepID=A0ABV2YER2_9ACTN|nr:MMPL family transporter [Streptomyces fragilis]
MQATRRWRRLVPVLLVVVVWVLAGGVLGPYAGKLSGVATNDQASFLPESAESTEVAEEQRKFESDRTVPAIVVWVTEEGRVTAAQRQAAGEALAEAARTPGVKADTPGAGQLIPSEDGRALSAVLPLESADEEESKAAVDSIRSDAARVDGMNAYVTGPAATRADLSEAFAGIDGILLLVALCVVLLILLVVYRSVLLPLVVIITSVFALSLACAVVYALARRDVVSVDGQVQGILFILVIGAATDYALLLTARFREELALGHEKYAAMRTALRQTAGAVTASGLTVALGLLALMVSDLSNNRALGPVGAIGVVCAMAAALTFLPAVLVLLGNAAYWPTRPASAKAKDRREHGLWHRVADLVDRRPRRIWITALIGLAVCAAFSPLLAAKGTPLDEIFVNDAPSVTGQRALGQHFPAGSGNPAVIVARADRVGEVTRAAAATEGVSRAVPVSAEGPGRGKPLVVDGEVRIDATLEAAADSDAAKETIPRLRDAVHAVEGADALVGGYTAQQYDTQATAARDRALIVPVVLAIILVILVVLLRGLLLPVLLVLTVGLNYLATLGVTALLFRYGFGFTGTDASVPLYGFVFLVALGVDYNIFLMTRVREETLRHGTREGIRTGLAATGGVITSAGVVLAATFAALTVIPLAFMAFIAFIVAFGVLLDTLVVRSLLVPSLARDLGARVWWPNRSMRP